MTLSEENLMLKYQRLHATMRGTGNPACVHDDDAFPAFWEHIAENHSFSALFGV
jgi:hypothetical protein